MRVNLSKEFRVGTAVANLCTVRAQEPTKLGNGRSGAAEVGAALPRRARRKRLFLELWSRRSEILLSLGILLEGILLETGLFPKGTAADGGSASAGGRYGGAVEA